MKTKTIFNNQSSKLYTLGTHLNCKYYLFLGHSVGSKNLAKFWENSYKIHLNEYNRILSK